MLECDLELLHSNIVKGSAMAVKVQLIDGTFCRVVPRGLDLLLSQNPVKRFLRSSSWAAIGRDPMRSSHRSRRHGL